VTDRALRDLAIIYGRIGAESSEQAARWFNRLEKPYSVLRNIPTAPHWPPKILPSGIFSMAESHMCTG
jgi:plasmid stabilization system protein ParE